MKKRRIQKATENRDFINKEKKLEEIHYRIIIVLAIIAVGYHFLIQPKTIGHDLRNTIFVFLIPTIFGMIILGIYRRQFLIDNFLNNKGFGERTFMIFFFLLQGIIFSYLSFGQLAQIGWDTINYREAQRNPQEIIVCDVERFWSKRNSKIDFKLNDRPENFKVEYSVIKQYEDKKPNNYKLEIKVHKGIWNHYLVDGYTISKK